MTALAWVATIVAALVGPAWLVVWLLGASLLLTLVEFLCHVESWRNECRAADRRRALYGPRRFEG